MRKTKKRSFGYLIVGFFLFFATIFVTSSLSIFVYYHVNKHSNGNTLLIAVAVVGMIFCGAVICSTIDYFRRKKMIEKPVKIILEATQKIASGNFNIKLIPAHEYLKYDEYDLIFENINTMTAELSKNELLKNDFISNVSHEIKTPLAVIQNYANALQSPDLDKNKRSEFLKGLVVQTKKLSDLISNILKLNKLENQKIVPEIETFDLSELLRISALSFESLFDKKDISLKCDIDEMKITSSKSLLEIVFNNLISNAIKFTDNGGKITIALKELNGYAVIKVKDTGCGIPKEVGEHIFEKFYQGDRSRFTDGNGLGLALVKKVIDVIGGEISVQSKVGKGSTFIIKLKKD